MTADASTLAFYDREASAYASRTANDVDEPWLGRFSAQLEPGARVLDFGCGSGWAADALTRAGFRVTAVDGSAGLAAEAARRYGIEVRIQRFEDFDDPCIYDAVWASFSLLHDTRDAMPGNLARLHRALVPGGRLYLGLKAGTGEARDRLGRRYAYYGADEIAGLLTDAGFTGVEVLHDAGESYDGTPDQMLHVFARRAE